MPESYLSGSATQARPIKGEWLLLSARSERALNRSTSSANETAEQQLQFTRPYSYGPVTGLAIAAIDEPPYR